MKTIGITGRSGCGKSSVTALLRQKGYPVVDGDELSRQILQKGSPCLAQLAGAFGEDILDEEGNLRRRLLADRAFATAEGTARLTAIPQPEIYRRLDRAIDRAQAAGQRLFFVDGAVIVGTPFEARCDALVLVAAPYETSVQRICARDGISPAMARRRLDAQLPEKTLREVCGLVIENNGTLPEMEEQCRALLEALRKEAYGPEKT